jgi:predicted metal-dependent phosphoesterase TrpH
MGMLKVDLHHHTSEDPVDSIHHDAIALVDRAVVLGFDAIAITLHDLRFENERVNAYARERRLTLLTGIERTIGGRHVLLVNFPEPVEAVRTFDDVATLKRHAPNGLVVAPHPFFPDRSCLRRAIDERPDVFDAVEWSYFWTYGINFNAPAERWARAHGKPVIGNSDTHDLRQLGRTCSMVESENHPDAICEAIRAGRVSLQTTPVPPLELLKVFGGMTLRPKKRGAPVIATEPTSKEQPC